MKKIFLFVIFSALAITISLPVVTRAQMMGNIGNSTVVNNQIIQEEAEGKAILGKLQSQQTSCANLTDDNFEKLGDYFMGQMMGSSHSAMDALMTQRIGEDNNRLMHIALGKRFSGCNTSAVFPSQGESFLPMMGMMGGWSSSNSNNNYQPNNFNSMMGNYYNNGYSMMGYGGIGWIPMILWWTLIIVGIVLLIRWITNQSRTGSGNHGKTSTALDTLKDRYAKGEIDKKEFEEKKKDLTS